MAAVPATTPKLPPTTKWQALFTVDTDRHYTLFFGLQWNERPSALRSGGLMNRPRVLCE
jgi:hypothetical protein